jgi:adenylate cyclase
MNKPPMMADGPWAVVATHCDPIVGWLAEQGLLGVRADRLMKGYCDRLVAAGVPLLRVFVGVETLHPLYEGYSYVWKRGAPALETETYFRSAETSPDYFASPFHHMRQQGLVHWRQRLTRPAEPEFPIYEKFRAAGGTDYFVRMVGFGREGSEAPADGEGMIISFLTDGAEGFSDDDLALIERTFPTFALAVRSAKTFETAQAVAITYLGKDAGRRVLEGAIDRGALTEMRAVIYFADLRGFTATTEDMAPADVVAMLDDYLDCLAWPVLERNGEILKFLGDGVLGVFEVDEVETRVACHVALGAARAAYKQIAAINRERAAAGKPVMHGDIVLHLGDVLYGNVGVEGRLDFTVIGPAVNEASRIEAFCDPLDQHVLVSQAFHAAAVDCRDALVSVGQHQLRGVRRTQELFTLNPALLHDDES